MVQRDKNKTNLQNKSYIQYRTFKSVYTKIENEDKKTYKY